jgi:hypothetical protein
VIRLVKNEKGVVFDSYDQVLGTPVNDFTGIISPAAAQRLKQAILDQTREVLRRRRQGHLHRLEVAGRSTALLQAAYSAKGRDLERTLETVLTGDPFGFNCVRIGKQRHGEADLHLTHPKGLVVIQVTASDDDRKPIGWDKAREVLGSAVGRNPISYVVIGRPDFHHGAQVNADGLRAEGLRPLLLLPLPVMMELYVLALEGKVKPAYVLAYLAERRGYATIAALLDELNLADA